MIIGAGVDIVEIDRISGMIDRYGERFLAKVFTPAEIAYCSDMARPAIHFAGRWAAKEAFYKALPPQYQPLSTWKSVEFASGGTRPALTILNLELNRAMQHGGIIARHTSISHERKQCVAVVILEGA